MQHLNLNISTLKNEQLNWVSISDIEAVNWMQLPAILEVDYMDFEGKQDILLSVLSEQEKLRSFNYHKKSDSLRFLTGRAMLRKLLGKLLNIHPSQLVIEQGVNKKPVLKFPQSKLHFNVSHTKNKVLIAVDKKPIGVDVECAENAIKAPIIGKKVLSIQEQFAIIQSENQRREFCLLWTRKEAFLKAIGKGIDDDVASIPSLDGRYKVWGLNEVHASEWTIQSYTNGSEYVYSLAFNPNEEGQIAFYKLNQDFKF